MKVIEVPVFNDDGSVKLTQLLSPGEAQSLLQFAINFLTASGMITAFAVSAKKEDPQMELPTTVQ